MNEGMGTWMNKVWSGKASREKAVYTLQRKGVGYIKPSGMKPVQNMSEGMQPGKDR